MLRVLVPILGWLLCLVWVSAGTSAFAQPMSFKVLTDRAGCGSCAWLQASGEIGSGTAEEFISFVQEHPFISVVQIDSSGGNLNAALEMGEYVRSKNLSVVVGGANVRTVSGDQIATRISGQCMSACVYFLAAGQSRSQVLDSVIGVHQFYGEVLPPSIEDGLDAGQRVSGLLIDYLSRMGVSPSMVTAASGARPDEIYILSDTEMLRFKLLTSLQEQFSAAPGYGRALGIASTGIDPFGDTERIPPASVEECGKARFSLADTGSVSEMQSKNRFFRDVCEEYFDTIGILDLTECQEAWDDAYQVLQEHGTRNPLSDEMQLGFVARSMLISMGACSNERLKKKGGRQRQ